MVCFTILTSIDKSNQLKKIHFADKNHESSLRSSMILGYCKFEIQTTMGCIEILILYSVYCMLFTMMPRTQSEWDSWEILYKNKGEILKS